MLFLHVGLHKTGTTFVQKAVFPKWSGISYISWTNLEVFLRLKEDKTYLVSREGFSGQNWAHHDTRAQSLKRLAEMFPQARVLISFRKHSSYIVSSYRQYLQRGGPLSFEEYFDLDGDEGFMKRGDYVFRRKIEAVEEYFRHRPFVFLNEELGSGMELLLKDLQGYIGGQAPQPHEISSRRYNQSVGYYPAQLLRRINAVSRSEFNPKGKYRLDTGVFKTLGLTPKNLCKNWLSYLPLPNPPLVPEARTEAIDLFYREDWDYIRARVAMRQDTAGQDLSTPA